MGTTDPRIDAYIDNSAEFAQPILIHLRKVIHKACPDVEETMKWSFPHFMYKGMLCSMASFKAHCAFGFWKGRLLGEVMGEDRSEDAMGDLGKITSPADLPKEKVLIGYIREAMKLNDKKAPSKPKTKTKSETKELDIPDYFMAAVKKSKKSLATFESFSYTNRKEYVQWVTEAKTEATREKRLATAVEWMEEGKIRHWKYQDC